MTNRNEIYRCPKCGNIVEVMHKGASDLACCGTKMIEIIENSQDAAKEKHIPVITKLEGGYKIVVGEVTHPMDRNHSIEWIELIAGDKVYTKHLKPSDPPEAEFKTDADDVKVRAYCNLHGLWTS